METSEIIGIVEEAVGTALNEEKLGNVIDRSLEKHLEALPRSNVRTDPPEGLQSDVTFSQWLGDVRRMAMGADPRFVNTDTMVRIATKDLAETTDSAGGYLVPTEESRELLNLVNTHSVMRALCREVPMQARQITFPTLASGLTAYWVPEATDTEGLTPDGTHQEDGEKPRSDIALGQMAITAHVCAAKVVVSNQLLEDSDPAIDAVLRGLFAETLGSALDVAILRGAGTATDPITGLANKITTNVLAAGANFDWDDVLGLIHAVYENSPGAQSVPVVGHSKAEKVLMKLKDGDGQYLYKGPAAAGRVPSIWGEPFYRNGNVLTDLGAGNDETRLFAGDFARHAFVGNRSGLVIKTNPYSNPEFSFNQTAFIAEFRVGFNVSSEARFAMLTGVPTS